MRNSQAVVSIIVNFPSEVIARKRRAARRRIFPGRPTRRPPTLHIRVYTRTRCPIPFLLSRVRAAERVVNHNFADSFRSFTDCEFTRFIGDARATAPPLLRPIFPYYGNDVQKSLLSLLMLRSRFVDGFNVQTESLSDSLKCNAGCMSRDPPEKLCNLTDRFPRRNPKFRITWLAA